MKKQKTLNPSFFGGGLAKKQISLDSIEDSFKNFVARQNESDKNLIDKVPQLAMTMTHRASIKQKTKVPLGMSRIKSEAIARTTSNKDSAFGVGGLSSDKSKNGSAQGYDNIIGFLGNAFKMKIAAHMQESVDQQGKTPESKEQLEEILMKKQREKAQAQMKRQQILEAKNDSNQYAFDAFFGGSQTAPDMNRVTSHANSNLNKKSQDSSMRSLSESQNRGGELKQKSRQSSFIKGDRSKLDKELFNLADRLPSVASVPSETSRTEAPGQDSCSRRASNSFKFMRSTAGNKDQATARANDDSQIAKIIEEEQLSGVDQEEGNARNFMIDQRRAMLLDSSQEKEENDLLSTSAFLPSKGLVLGQQIGEKRETGLLKPPGSTSNRVRHQPTYNKSVSSINLGYHFNPVQKSRTIVQRPTEAQSKPEQQYWKAFLKPQTQAPFEIVQKQDELELSHSRNKIKPDSPARGSAKKNRHTMHVTSSKNLQQYAQVNKRSTQVQLMVNSETEKSSDSCATSFKTSQLSRRPLSQRSHRSKFSPARSNHRKTNGARSIGSQEDFLDTSSSDYEIQVEPTQMSSSDIFDHLDTASIDKTKKINVIVEEQDSEIERERDRELQRKITSWHMTNEYKRLGKTARRQVENWMHQREEKHSATFLFLTRLTDRAEKLWPPEEQRIPFYQRDWIQRNIKKELAAMHEREQKKRKDRMNDSFRSRRKHTRVTQQCRQSNLTSKWHSTRVLDVQGARGQLMAMRTQESFKMNLRSTSGSGKLDPVPFKRIPASTFGASRRFLNDAQDPGKRNTDKNVAKMLPQVKIDLEKRRSTEFRPSATQKNQLTVAKLTSTVERHKTQRASFDSPIKVGEVKARNSMPTQTEVEQLLHQQEQILGLRDDEAAVMMSSRRTSTENLISLDFSQKRVTSQTKGNSLRPQESIQTERVGSSKGKIPSELHEMTSPQLNSVKQFKTGQAEQSQSTRKNNQEELAQTVQVINSDLKEVQVGKTRNHQPKRDICQQNSAAVLPNEHNRKGLVQESVQSLSKTVRKTRGAQNESALGEKEQNKEALTSGKDVLSTQVTARDGNQRFGARSLRRPGSTGTIEKQLTLPKTFVKSLVKQMKRQSIQSETPLLPTMAETLRPRVVNKKGSCVSLSSKVVMGSDLVNPLNKQIRKLKRKSSHHASVSRHQIIPVDFQLDRLVNKLQEKAETVVSRTAMSNTLASGAPLSTMRSLKSARKAEQQTATATATDSMFQHAYSTTMAFTTADNLASQTESERKPTSPEQPPSKQKVVKAKKMKLHSKKARREIYLNLVEEKQQNTLKAINEDEATEKGDFASPQTLLEVNVPMHASIVDAAITGASEEQGMIGNPPYAQVRTQIVSPQVVLSPTAPAEQKAQPFTEKKFSEMVQTPTEAVPFSEVSEMLHINLQLVEDSNNSGDMFDHRAATNPHDSQDNEEDAELSPASDRDVIHMETSSQERQPLRTKPDEVSQPSKLTQQERSRKTVNQPKIEDVDGPYPDLEAQQVIGPRQLLRLKRKLNAASANKTQSARNGSKRLGSPKVQKPRQEHRKLRKATAASLISYHTIQVKKEDEFKDSYLAALPGSASKERPFSEQSLSNRHLSKGINAMSSEGGKRKIVLHQAKFRRGTAKPDISKSHESLAMVLDFNRKATTKPTMQPVQESIVEAQKVSSSLATSKRASLNNSVVQLDQRRMTTQGASNSKPILAETATHEQASSKAKQETQKKKNLHKLRQKFMENIETPKEALSGSQVLTFDAYKSQKVSATASVVEPAENK